MAALSVIWQAAILAANASRPDWFGRFPGPAVDFRPPDTGQGTHLSARTPTI